MIELSFLISFFLNLLLAAMVPAQQQQIVVNVVDPAEKRLPKVPVTCEEGCPVVPSDPNGRAVLNLMPESISSGWVQLQITSGWVFISPWDGRWPVAKRSLTIVVARKGDKQQLRDPQAVSAIVARVLKEIGPSLDRQISEDERQQVLKQQAENAGLSIEEVKLAINELSNKTQDPYQQGLIALYKQNYQESTPLLKESVRRLKEEAEKVNAKLADASLFLGQSLYKQRMYQEALKAFRESSTIKNDDVDIASWMGVTLIRLRKFQDAEPVFTRALETRRRSLGEDHLLTSRSYNNLGMLYLLQRKYNEAATNLSRALESRVKLFGADHPETATNYNNLAFLFYWQGNSTRAEEYFERAANIRLTALGKDNLLTANSLTNLAFIYYKNADRSAVRLGSPFTLLTDVIEIRRKMLGENHEETATAYNNLAVLFLRERKYDEAEQGFNKALVIRRRAIGEENSQTIKSYYALGKVYLQRDKLKPAEQLFENALKLLEKLMTGDPALLTDSAQDLTDVYESVDLFPKTEPGVRGMASFEDLIDIGGFNIDDFADTYLKLLRLQNRSGEIDQVRKRFQAVSEKMK